MAEGTGGRRGAPWALPEAASRAARQNDDRVTTECSQLAVLPLPSARPPLLHPRGVAQQCQGPTRHRHQEHHTRVPRALPGSHPAQT